MGGATPRVVVLGTIRKQAERALGASPWSLPQALPASPHPFLEDQSKPFSLRLLLVNVLSQQGGWGAGQEWGWHRLPHSGIQGAFPGSESIYSVHTCVPHTSVRGRGTPAGSELGATNDIPKSGSQLHVGTEHRGPGFDPLAQLCKEDPPPGRGSSHTGRMWEAGLGMVRETHQQEDYVGKQPGVAEAA